jgi:hypothetical protein
MKYVSGVEGGAPNVNRSASMASKGWAISPAKSSIRYCNFLTFSGFWRNATKALNKKAPA